MNRVIKNIFTFSVISFSLYFCTPGIITAQGFTGDIFKKITDANTKFGFDLVSKLIQKDEKKNVVVSPASISLALAMTCNGAGGSTREVIARTLGLEDLSDQEINDSYTLLMQTLNGKDSLVSLLAANSLWMNQDFPLNDAFQAIAKTSYSADVENLDFTDPKSPSIINSWVNNKTQGKIKTIIDNLNKNDVLVLLNAIYFKGKWKDKFPEGLTKEKDFHLLGGGLKKVQMMSQGGWFKYLQGTNFQAISLPYGSGKISMHVILPDSSTSLRKFIDNTTPKTWNEWISSMHSMKGDIQFPRFTLENDYLLNKELISLGMGRAFDPADADFKKMVHLGKNENVFISEVRHKTYIDVNEKGTEAAAATSVRTTMTTSAISIDNPERFNMIVDRPFIFAIRDDTSGFLLFIGMIVDP
jgi:serine protease inhibitor